MRITNKKARFDYKIEQEYEAGIVLTGSEVKAVKQGKADLSHAHVRIIKGEVYLISANISVPEGDSKRTRKLLLNKKEITSITSKVKGKSLTLVPISMYTKHGLIKLKIGLAKPKKKYQKKEKIKKRDIEREIARELKDRR